MCGSVVNRAVETEHQKVERERIEKIRRIEKLKEAVRIEEQKELQRRIENIKMRTNVRHGLSIYNRP
jgi:hypothetical protein